MSQYAHLSEVDPEFAPFIAMLRSQRDWSEEDISVQQERFNSVFLPMLMGYRRPRLPAASTYRVNDYSVPVEDGEITVRCLTPTPCGSTGRKTFPLLVWIHGGAWMFGGLDSDDYLLRMICVECQISIVNVDFRLCPQQPFPVGLNDCYTALKWAAAHTRLYQANLDKGFIIAGQSSGAHYAAIIALRAREDPFFRGRAISGQLLQIPHVIHAHAYPQRYKHELLSMEQNKDAPLFDRGRLEVCYDRLQVKKTDREFSPLLANSHQGLPPTYIQICGLDPLRDEGLLYERILRQSGVATKLDIYPGVAHGFQTVFPHIKAAVKYDEDFSNGIKWLLSKVDKPTSRPSSRRSNRSSKAHRRRRS
ncbi:alpha/beta-hydrolase [Dentipellis sp. KUC8613]|nr:alpha/beta-hydrolase [Dentipellis sp. KUC8613]